jgi:3-hydroxy acid dehydrogenase/malonic semialdehyde reductase
MNSNLAIITGATSGIGKATAFILAKNGYDLILTGRRKERLEEIAEELRSAHGVKVYTLNFDIREKEAVAKAIDALPGEFRKINILVNNAGLAAGIAPIDQGLVEDWDQMIDTNVKGVLYITKAILPLMPHDGSAHIVNVGSIAGKETYANGNVYCATKAALDHLSQGMRLDLAKHNIRVSAIHPGAAETEFSEVRFKGDKEKARKVYEGFENLVAEDIAEAIWFMLNRPRHVNINEMVIMPTAQPNAGTIIRSGLK